MKTFEYKDGYKSVYDETFQAGDLITAYHKGYHEFVEYKERENHPPLVLYKKVYNLNGKKHNSSKILTCDAGYCRRAKDHILKSIEEKTNEIELLKQIVQNHEN